MPPEPLPEQNKETILPWQSAESIVKCANDSFSHIRKDFLTPKGEKIATFTSVPSVWYGGLRFCGLAIEGVQPNLPVTITSEGVHVTREVLSGKEPDIAFEYVDKNVAIVPEGDSVEMRLAPVVDQKMQERDGNFIIFGGKKALITDDSGLPNYYSVAAGQMLQLTLPLPDHLIETGIDRPRLPMDIQKVQVNGLYDPVRPTDSKDALYPERNSVHLPNGVRILMQPGGKLQLQYRDASGNALQVLDYEAKGALQFIRAPEYVAAIEEAKKHQAEIKEGCEKLQEARVELKAAENAMSRAIKPEERAEVGNKINAAREKIEKNNVFKKMAEKAKEAEEKPLLPSGALGDQFAQAERTLREMLVKQEKEQLAASKAREMSLANTLNKLSNYGELQREGHPAITVDAVAMHTRNDGGHYFTRHKHGVFINTTSDGATRVQAVRDAVIAISGNELIVKEDDITAREMRSLLLNNDQTPAGSVSVPKGTEITNGMLVIDSGNPVTLKLLGERKSFKKSLHILGGGPLTVDMQNSAQDQYSNGMTIRTINEQQPIHLKVDKQWERRMFEYGTLARNDRNLEGLLIDANGKVTGMQIGKNGVAIQLQPGQKLTIDAAELRTKERPVNIEQESLYPEHRFTLTGGMDQQAALGALKAQHQEQERTKPSIHVPIIIDDIPFIPIPQVPRLNAAQSTAKSERRHG